MSKLLSQSQKNWGFSFGVNNILILLNYSNCILVLFVSACNIALISGVLPVNLHFKPGVGPAFNRKNRFFRCIMM